MNPGMFPGVAQGMDALLPYAVTLWHHNSTVVRGNAISILAASASYPFCMYSFQNAAQQYDEWVQYFYLAPGVYNLTITGQKNGTGGIVKLYLNGSLIVENDRYNATGIPATDTVSNISVQGGLMELRGQVVTRNGSSSGWQCQITMMAFQLAQSLRL